MGCSNSSTLENKEKTSLAQNHKNNEKTQEEDIPSKKKSNKNLSTATLDNDSDIKVENKNFLREIKTRIKADYQFLEKIGQGAFGTVHKAMHKKTKVIRAIKSIKKMSVHEDNKTFLQEIEILARLDHPNILKIFDYYLNEQNYYIVSEMASGGELYDQIVALQNFTEANAAIIMKQLLSAVCYLHSNNIVHRDLKPENILMENKNSGDLSIKIIDFGAATTSTQNKLREVTGTAYYIAPEVLKNNYNNKCDLWSCGVILYILLSGVPPFYGENEPEIFDAVKKGEYNFDAVEWDNVSLTAKDLINKLLKYNPTERIDAEQALKHPWIQELNTNKYNMEKTKSAFENLKKFTAKQKLQQASIAFIVHQMSTNDSVKELREIFKSLDSSGDGRLSTEELKKGFLQHFKNSFEDEDEFDQLVDNLDGDGNGFIEYEEFLRATLKMESILSEKNLELAFNYFDEDKSGKLEPSEIKKILGIKSDSHKEGEILKKMISEIDSNNDGVVSFDEFKNLMKKVLQQ